MAENKYPKTEVECQIVSLVKLRRRELNRTQTEIANLFGFTRGYIGQIEMESHPSMYSYDQLNELAKYLECSLKDFMPENPL